MRLRSVVLFGWCVCLLSQVSWAGSAPPPPAQSPPIVPTKPSTPRPAPAPPAPSPPIPHTPQVPSSHPGVPPTLAQEELEDFGFISMEQVTETDADGNTLTGLDFVCGYSGQDGISERLKLLQFHLGSRTDGVRSVSDFGVRYSPAGIWLGPLRLRASFALGLEHRQFAPNSSVDVYGLIGAEAALNLENRLELVYGVDKRFVAGGETRDQFRLGVRWSPR